MASRPVASSVPATSPQLNFRRAVEEEIEDPVSGDLMTKAVTIFPCGHVFNEATIIQCLAHNKLCPLDRKPIEKFTPNTAIRNLADKAIAQPVDEGPSEEAESHFQKGKAFSDQWNYEAAVESFLKALELSPTYEKAQAFLDFCLQRSSTSPSLSEPPISPTSPSREEKQVFSQSPENSKESYVDLLLSLIGKSSVQENASLKAMLVRQLEELMSHADHELSQKESELFRWAKKLFIDEKVSQFVADKLIQIGGGKEKKELEVPSALPSSIPSPAAEERTTFSPVAPDDLAPNPALKETIESYQAQGSQAIQRGVDEKNVPQPHGQDQNDALAKPLLVGAQDLEEKKQFADAEKLYLLALQFTSKSKDYAHLPRLFEKKGEKERAASAYVVLADLQLKEDKAAAAIDTLKEFLKLAPHPAIKEKLGNVFNNHGQKQVAAILFLELAQQAIYNKDTLSAMRLCRLALEAFPGYAVTWRTMAACSTESLETVKVLLKGANESSMPIKERIGLCKMVLIKEPEHLQAKLLFLELNQLNERLSPAPIRSIGMAEWAAPHLIKNLPPYPQELKDFLAGDCTIWSGKKRLETHIVVPLFKHITTVFNGFPVQVPRTLKTLDELDKTSGGVGFKHIWDNISETDQNRPAGEFHYAVLTKDVLPGSRSKPYDFQKQLVESKGYKVPPLLDATTAILWEHQRTGACLFGDNPSTYTRCREEMDFFQLTVGGFVPGGMWVGGLWVHPGRNCGDDVSVGIAGFLEFGAVPPPSSPNPAIGSTSPPPQPSYQPPLIQPVYAQPFSSIALDQPIPMGIPSSPPASPQLVVQVTEVEQKSLKEETERLEKCLKAVKEAEKEVTRTKSEFDAADIELERKKTAFTKEYDEKCALEENWKRIVESLEGKLRSLQQDYDNALQIVERDGTFSIDDIKRNGDALCKSKLSEKLYAENKRDEVANDKRAMGYSRIPDLNNPVIKSAADVRQEKYELMFDAEKKLEKCQQEYEEAKKLQKTELNERLPPSAPLSSIGKAEWAAPHLIKNLPSYPQELKDFLAGDCTIWLGKKRSETHIVVPLFKHITTVVNGSPVLMPRTIKALDELDKSSGGVGCIYIWEETLKTDLNRAAGEFHYGVLTKDVLPGSRNKPYDFQKQLVESKGYKVPPLLDAITAILWENRRTGARLFGDNPSTYTRCREEINGYQLVVGGFAPGGLSVLYYYYVNAGFGVAGFREF